MGHRSLNSNEVHWRLTSGCTVIGPGCDSCPANVDDSFNVTKIYPDQLLIPAQTKEPKTFYLSIGSDFFQDDVPESFIIKAFRVMNPIQVQIS